MKTDLSLNKIVSHIASIETFTFLVRRRIMQPYSGVRLNSSHELCKKPRVAAKNDLAQLPTNANALGLWGVRMPPEQTVNLVGRNWLCLSRFREQPIAGFDRLGRICGTSTLSFQHHRMICCPLVFMGGVVRGCQVAERTRSPVLRQ
jgi:hypothetical protein